MDFLGCTAMSCVRQLDNRIVKTRANYLVEETCRYAKANVCTYRRYYGKGIKKGEEEG